MSVSPSLKLAGIIFLIIVFLSRVIFDYNKEGSERFKTMRTLDIAKLEVKEFPKLVWLARFKLAVEVIWYSLILAIIIDAYFTP